MPPKQQTTRNSLRETSPPVVETIEQIIERRVAEAIAQLEASRNSNREVVVYNGGATPINSEIPTNNSQGNEPNRTNVGDSGQNKRKWNDEGSSSRGQPKPYLGNKPKCDRCARHHNGECLFCLNCKGWGHITKNCRNHSPTPPNSENARTYAATTATGSKPYLGKRPKCNQYERHHEGDCVVCDRCNQWGHRAHSCRNKPPTQTNPENARAATEPKPYLGKRPKCRKCERHHEDKCNFCNIANVGVIRVNTAKRTPLTKPTANCEMMGALNVVSPDTRRTSAHNPTTIATIRTTTTAQPTMVRLSKIVLRFNILFLIRRFELIT